MYLYLEVGSEFKDEVVDCKSKARTIFETMCLAGILNRRQHQ